MSHTSRFSLHLWPSTRIAFPEPILPQPIPEQNHGVFAWHDKCAFQVPKTFLDQNEGGRTGDLRAKATKKQEVEEAAKNTAKNTTVGENSMSKATKASSFRTLVLVGVATASSAAFIPFNTTLSEASKMAEVRLPAVAKAVLPLPSSPPLSTPSAPPPSPSSHRDVCGGVCAVGPPPLPLLPPSPTSHSPSPPPPPSTEMVVLPSTASGSVSDYSSALQTSIVNAKTHDPVGSVACPPQWLQMILGAELSLPPSLPSLPLQTLDHTPNSVCTDLLLVRGWQLVSFTASSSFDVLKSADFQMDDQILSRERRVMLATYTGDEWVGELVNLGFSYAKGYKVYFSGKAGTVIKQSGEPPEIPVRDVMLFKGWNWMGHVTCMSYNVNLDITAIGINKFTVDDQIKTRSGSSLALTTWTGYKWEGGLSELKPGLGYNVFVAKRVTIRFPLPSPCAPRWLPLVMGDAHHSPVSDCDVSGPLSM